MFEALDLGMKVMLNVRVVLILCKSLAWNTSGFAEELCNDRIPNDHANSPFYFVVMFTNFNDRYVSRYAYNG